MKRVFRSVAIIGRVTDLTVTSKTVQQIPVGKVTLFYGLRNQCLECGLGANTTWLRNVQCLVFLPRKEKSLLLCRGTNVVLLTCRSQRRWERWEIPPPLFNSIINSGEEANYWLIIRLSVSWLGERVYEPRCGISPSLSKRGHPHCRALQWSGFGLLQSLIDLEWGCILTPIYSCLADTSCKLFFLDVDNRSRSNTLLCVIMKIWL